MTTGTTASIEKVGLREASYNYTTNDDAWRRIQYRAAVCNKSNGTDSAQNGLLSVHCKPELVRTRKSYRTSQVSVKKRPVCIAPAQPSKIDRVWEVALIYRCVLGYPRRTETKPPMIKVSFNSQSLPILLES